METAADPYLLVAFAAKIDKILVTNRKALCP